MLSLLLPASFQHFLSEELLQPLLDTFTGLLSAVAGPLIFLSILCGIIGMSDVATFGRIGKRMIGRFLTMSTMIVVIAGPILRMPGLPKLPQAIKIKLDENGEITGLS